MYFAVVNGKSILIFGTRYVKVIFDVKFENLYNFESIVYSNFTGKNGSYIDNCETHKKLT